MQHILERNTVSTQEKILFWGIMIPMLVMDWNFSRPGFTIPLFLSYPGLIAGILLPLFFLANKHFNLSLPALKTFNRYHFIVLCLVIVFIIQGLFYPAAWATYGRDNWIEVIGLLLCFQSGYLYAVNPDVGERLFSRFALYAAYGSVFSFCLRVAGVSDSLPFGVAGWPMRLFFLFGFCWYLCWYLAGFMSGKKTSRSILVGLIACSLEVVITLQKPIIWAAFFSMATLFLIFRAFLPGRKFGKFKTKLVKLSVAVVLVLVVINNIFHEVVVDDISTFISVRILHQSDEVNDITLDRAAGGRFEVWETALKDFKRSPWVGIGLNSVHEGGGGASISLHNGYLDLLSILGISGLTLFLYGIWYWLWRVVKSLKFKPLLLVQTSCLIYFVGILMFNMGGTSRIFPGVSYFIAMVFGISLRLAVYANSHRRKYSPDNIRRGKLEKEIAF
ncbi:MAG TPA: O-antigen ligase family protein [Hanamia sp.]